MPARQLRAVDRAGAPAGRCPCPDGSWCVGVSSSGPRQGARPVGCPVWVDLGDGDGEPEGDVVVAVGRDVGIAARRPGVAGAEVPAAATQNLAVAVLWSGRVDAGLVAVGAVPVLAPFPALS